MNNPTCPNPEEQPTLTPAQVSRILGIGLNQTYNALKTGEIPMFTIGKRMHIPTAAFRKLLGLDSDPK